MKTQGNFQCLAEVQESLRCASSPLSPQQLQWILDYLIPRRQNKFTQEDRLQMYWVISKFMPKCKRAINLQVGLLLNHTIFLSSSMTFSTMVLKKRKKERKRGPWLLQLSGLSASLQTKRSLVRFPVRAHAWVADLVPIWGRARDK